MFKLLIVDDEEFICNSIASLIDWEAFDIKPIGTCADGVDAYHTILDELPDIVMTDIRMPGISGLELIERISKAGLDTQFIILSGYSEFEYAKTAMKYGVKHYLLKPCDEEQIMECIHDIIKDCNTLRFINDNNGKSSSKEQKILQKTLIYNLIREGISLPELNDDFFSHYSLYVNLNDTAYQLYCFYYLEERNLKDCCLAAADYFSAAAPNLDYYSIYVSNVFLVFFPSFETDYAPMDHYFNSLSFQQESVKVSCERIPFPDLQTLLNSQIPKLKRFDVLFFIDGETINPMYNYNYSISNLSNLLSVLTNTDIDLDQKTKELNHVLYSVTDKVFLTQLVDHLLISLNIKLSYNTLMGITEFLYDIHQMDSISDIRSLTSEKVIELLKNNNNNCSAFIDKLNKYTMEHHSDPDLTLKWICENYLYMNVNYVSRVFFKETGNKFSNYLVMLRVEKAKELFNKDKTLKIHEAAELVGCGNNPYYFSKIFKKCTGMTPTAYLAMME